MHKTLSSRLIGFIASLILTSTAFLMILQPTFFHFGVKEAIIGLLVLAALQSIVQSIFFLAILDEKGPRWNLVVFATTLSIILIIILGSIWIMDHLRSHMMSYKMM